MQKKSYLNLGCGSHFHKDWVNLDFVSTGEGVIEHNLLKGIPFEDNSFEVVYHSHVLEHFLREDGKKFIAENNRVLKSGGIIRIAIPNVEQIVKNYMQLLQKLKENPDDAYLQACYDWTMLEMYDQTVRNYSGGDMVSFLSQKNIINEDFVIERCGYEVLDIINSYRAKEKSSSNSQVSNYRPTIFSRIKNLPSKIKKKLSPQLVDDELKALAVGKFRLGGEIHCWMYDSFSLGRLLQQTGFTAIKECRFNESSIPNWVDYRLETVNGNVRKPDSLFMEARKK